MAAFAVAVVAAGVSACQQSPPGAAPSYSPSALSSATATPSASVSDGGVYVTGVKPGDDACMRIVSAIGYLDFVLVKPGRERSQPYDTAVRGRFGYVQGTISMYGPHLPASLRGAVETMSRTSHVLADSRTDPGKRPGLLRKYRSARDAITAACRKS